MKEQKEMEYGAVTVIIPNYNGIDYLDACIHSLLKQTLLPRIIVVDNGSKDKSIPFLKEKYKEGQILPDGRILHFKLIELGQNTGFSNAVNVGIRAADTEYVFLLNNDTIADEHATEQLMHTLRIHPKAFSAGAKMLSMQEKNRIDDCGDLYCALGWAFTPGKDRDSACYNKRAYITSACAGAAMYRREYFDEIGYFDEVHFCYLEDTDIGYRARITGYRNIYEPHAVVYHAGSASSGSRHNEFKVRLTAGNNLYFLYKNFTVLQMILNLPFLILGILIKYIFFSKKNLGAAYRKGLYEGVQKILHNPQKKVPFKMNHLGSYCILQIELWVNCIRRITG